MKLTSGYGSELARHSTKRWFPLSREKVSPEYPAEFSAYLYRRRHCHPPPLSRYCRRLKDLTMVKLFPLIPYHPDEVISVPEAAKMAGMSPRRIREWCSLHGIGRHLFPGGPWIVSRVALRMLLEGDEDALVSYKHGARASYPPVATHYVRAGLEHLLRLPDFAI